MRKEDLDGLRELYRRLMRQYQEGDDALGSFLTYLAATICAGELMRREIRGTAPDAEAPGQ